MSIPVIVGEDVHNAALEAARKIGPDNNIPNVLALKSKFDALKERCVEVATSIQAAIPLTDRPQASQEAFFLAFADLKLLEELTDTAVNTFKCINLEEASPETIQEPSGLLAALTYFAEGIIDMVVEGYGLSKEFVMPAIIKDLERQINLIETLVVRAEASLAAMDA